MRVFMRWIYELCLQPGVQIVLVQRTAIVLERERFRNVRVLVDGREEHWWRGNLRLVLPGPRP